MFTIFSTLFTLASPANYYYPNGDIKTSHSACNESAEVSTCCNPGDLCLSNGYCFQQFRPWGDRVTHGSCTDLTWESNSCPYYCSDGRLSLKKTAQACYLVGATTNAISSSNLYQRFHIPSLGELYVKQRLLLP